jgi:hypothetical protein
MIESLLGFVGALGLLVGSDAASASIARDRAAILSQCGCFEVTFSYTETAALKPGYPLRPPKQVKGLEWVEADRVSERSLSLQHLLIGGQGVQKHWRQVWDYEPRMLLEFQGQDRWKKRQIPPEEAAGRWAQRVYEVDDGPRYEGLGAWTHAGLSSWSSRAWSPLPRREYTQRSDYDVLVRQNRHQLNSDGWSHIQENEKVRLEAGKAVPLVREQGENRYRRVDEARCAEAKAYWAANKQTWHRVQGVWQEVYDQADVLRLRADLRGTPRWQRIFTLAAQPKAQLEAEVRQTIRAYRAP